jgi:stage IV sporulation protein FB
VPRAGYPGRHGVEFAADAPIPGPWPLIPGPWPPRSVFLLEPQRTNFDLHFSLGPFPVRVHPMFWVVSLILGAGSFQNPSPPVEVLLWVVVVFVSIVVHELGHALAMRWYGSDARIVLYAFGGLAIQEDSLWGNVSSYGSVRSPRQQIVISFAGPAAGFIVAGLLLLALRISGQQIHLIPWFVPFAFEPGIANEKLNLIVYDLLFVNVVWGLVNLLPVFPLDGGQISRAVFTAVSPYGGERQSLALSIAVAVALAVFAAVVIQDFFMVLLFGSLAFTSFQLWQAHGGGRW